MNRSLSVVNRLLLLLLIPTALSALFFSFLPPKRGENPLPTPPERTPPLQPLPALTTGPLFALHYEAPKVRLPDLSRELAYYGINGRPDADPDSPLVHLSLQADKEEIFSIPLNQPTYLLYCKGEEGNYRIAEKGERTSLWITPKSLPDDPSHLRIEVGMCNHEGELVQEPEEYREVTLRESSYGRNPKQIWKLGSFRADNSLLARMRARWIGADQLLELLGEQEGSVHRIEFGEGDSLYGCLVKLGGILYWNGERWCEVDERVDSRAFPILHLKKSEEKVAHIDVWNCDGRGHLAMTLMRYKECWQPERLIGAMKLVGARSWSRFILDSSGERIEVSPNDWLIQLDGSWQKIESVEEIEAVVSGELTGELLIIDKIERREGRTVLQANLFSPLHGELSTLTLPLVQGFSNGE